MPNHAPLVINILTFHYNISILTLNIVISVPSEQLSKNIKVVFNQSGV